MKHPTDELLADVAAKLGALEEHRHTVGTLSTETVEKAIARLYADGRMTAGEATHLRNFHALLRLEHEHRGTA